MPLVPHDRDRVEQRHPVDPRVVDAGVQRPVRARAQSDRAGTDCATPRRSSSSSAAVTSVTNSGSYSGAVLGVRRRRDHRTRRFRSRPAAATGSRARPSAAPPPPTSVRPDPSRGAGVEEHGAQRRRRRRVSSAPGAVQRRPDSDAARARQPNERLRDRAARRSRASAIGGAPAARRMRADGSGRASRVGREIHCPHPSECVSSGTVARCGCDVIAAVAVARRRSSRRRRRAAAHRRAARRPPARHAPAQRAERQPTVAIRLRQIERGQVRRASRRLEQKAAGLEPVRPAAPAPRGLGEEARSRSIRENALSWRTKSRLRAASRPQHQPVDRRARRRRARGRSPRRGRVRSRPPRRRRRRRAATAPASTDCVHAAVEPPGSRASRRCRRRSGTSAATTGVRRATEPLRPVSDHPVAADLVPAERRAEQDGRLGPRPPPVGGRRTTAHRRRAR